MSEANPFSVRPTKRCLDDLKIDFPSLEQHLHTLPHPLIAKAQQVPHEVAAGGAERIRAIKDRVWFKVKISSYRGAATELSKAEPHGPEVVEGSAWWWIGAAGERQEGSGADFYQSLKNEVGRAGKGSGSTDSAHLLPGEVDFKRLKGELAAQLTLAINRTVRKLVAGSISTGRTSVATISRHRITALVRAHGGEAYLAITAEGFTDPRLLAVILASVPGIESDDWLAEPKGVFGINPELGQIIYSALISPAVQYRLLEEFPGEPAASAG